MASLKNTHLGFYFVLVFHLNYSAFYLHRLGDWVDGWMCGWLDGDKKCPSSVDKYVLDLISMHYVLGYVKFFMALKHGEVGRGTAFSKLP